MLNELYHFSLSFENCCHHNQTLYLSNSLTITIYEHNDIFLLLLSIPCSRGLR